jgi:hypothetical protein
METRAEGLECLVGRKREQVIISAVWRLDKMGKGRKFAREFPRESALVIVMRMGIVGMALNGRGRGKQRKMSFDRNFGLGVT